MSVAVAGLSDDIADVHRLVRHIGVMSNVGKVFLCGSRSPASPKTPHEGSDWDLMAEVVDPPYMPKARREPWNLHVDLLFWDPTRTDAVEVWPEDPEGIWRAAA